MAIITSTNTGAGLQPIDAALGQAINDRVTAQLNRAVVLPQLLTEIPPDGKNVAWDVRFGEQDPNVAYVDGTATAAPANDVKKVAKLDYGSYARPFGVSGKARAAARAAGNPAALASLFLDAMGDAQEALCSGISKDFYTGPGTSERIHGLLASGAPAIGATGTYAGIDPTLPEVLGQWVGTEDTAAGALSLARMRAMRRQIYVKSGHRPDLVMMSPAQFEKYGALFDSTRYQTQDVRLNNGQSITLDGGWQILRFDGINVIEDRQIPDDHVLFLNSSFLAISQLVDDETAYSNVEGSAVQLFGTHEEQYGIARTKLRATMRKQNVNLGNTDSYALFCYPQLVCKRRNAHGLIKNLTV